MPNVLKISEISSAAASSEIDANAWLEVSVDVAGTPTTKYLTGEVLKEVIRDEFGGSFLVQGTGITITHNDGANTLTIAANIGTDVQAYSANLDALAADPLTATTAASTYLTIATATSTYQPLDADLTAIAALNPSANNLIYKNGSDAWDVATITTFGRSLIDDANDATARTTLGLDNVENTALSTWVGSTNITMLGTITTGTVPAARVSAGTFQSGGFVFGGALSGITGLTATGLVTAGNVDISTGGLIRFYMTGGGDIELQTATSSVAFKRNSGSTIFTIPDSGAVDFDTTGITMTAAMAAGAGTFSTVSGSTPAGTFKGYESITSTTSATAGEIRIGETASFQGRISYTGGTTALYVTNTWNNSNGDVVLRTAASTNTLVAKGYGSVLFRDGSVSLPSVSFQNDTDTGLYRAGANAFNLVAGGATVAAVTAAGLAVTGALSASGKITGAASTTSAASINIPVGTAPTSPSNGDMWFVGDVMYRRIGGVTKSLTFA